MEMMTVLLIVSVVAAASAPMINRKLVASSSGQGSCPWTRLANGSISYNMGGNEQTVLIGADQQRNDILTRFYLRAKDSIPFLTVEHGTKGDALRMFYNNNLMSLSTIENTTGALALGIGATTAKKGAIAIGPSTASANNSIALGYATAAGNSSLAIGTSSSNGGSVTAKESSIAIGSETAAGGTWSIAMGRTATTSASNTIAIGSKSSATFDDDIAIGNKAATNRTGSEYNRASIAIGKSSYAQGDAIAIGNEANASGGSAIAIGSPSSKPGSSGTFDVTASGSSSVAIGDGAQAKGASSVALGQNATVLGSKNSFTVGSNSVAIGRGSEVSANNSVAIGYNAKSASADQIVLGTENSTVYIPGKLVVQGSTMLGIEGESRVYVNLSDGDGVGMSVLQSDDTVTRKSIKNNNVDITYAEALKILSDRRLKNVGKAFVGGLAELKKLDLFNFTYKKDNTKTPHVGVMAQDLQKYSLTLLQKEMMDS